MYSKLALGLGAGLAAFVGYCVYFDHKRRADPQFRQKLTEKRLMASSGHQSDPQLTEEMQTNQNRIEILVEIPLLSEPIDPKQIESLFAEQVYSGEQMLERGQTDVGVDHICLALILSNCDTSFMNSLRETLSTELWDSVTQRLPFVGQKFKEKQRF